jgi:hypothetical protein
MLTDENDERDVRQSSPVPPRATLSLQAQHATIDAMQSIETWIAENNDNPPAATVATAENRDTFIRAALGNLSKITNNVQKVINACDEGQKGFKEIINACEESRQLVNEHRRKAELVPMDPEEIVTIEDYNDENESEIFDDDDDDEKEEEEEEVPDLDTEDDDEEDDEKTLPPISSILGKRPNIGIDWLTKRRKDFVETNIALDHNALHVPMYMNLFKSDYLRKTMIHVYKLFTEYNVPKMKQSKFGKWLKLHTRRSGITYPNLSDFSSLAVKYYGISRYEYTVRVTNETNGVSIFTLTFPTGTLAECWFVYKGRVVPQLSCIVNTMNTSQIRIGFSKTIATLSDCALFAKGISYWMSRNKLVDGEPLFAQPKEYLLYNSDDETDDEF